MTLFNFCVSIDVDYNIYPHIRSCHPRYNVTDSQRGGGGNSGYIRKSTVCRKFYEIINAVQFPVKYRGKFSQLHKMEIIWEKIDSDGCVSPREGQCSCVTENSMYMFGGVLHTDDLTETNDLLRFSFGKIHLLDIQTVKLLNRFSEIVI